MMGLDEVKIVMTYEEFQNKVRELVRVSGFYSVEFNYNKHEIKYEAFLPGGYRVTGKPSSHTMYISRGKGRNRFQARFV